MLSPPTEILAVALKAKNSLHNVRGYSPYQWSFGQNHNRLASFLQQYDNLPLHSQREDLDFETNLQVECQAQQAFLEADARRRLSRALHSRCRPLKDFCTGQLVYYFRRGRKEGSRYGGRWHGPARVLCHESTTISQERVHGGSVVWISHAGVLIRCSPEQLRLVTRDLSMVDREINGPRNFHSLLEGVLSQQKYVDLARDWIAEPAAEEPLPPDRPRFRLGLKRPASDLYQDPLPALDESAFHPSHGFPELAGGGEGASRDQGAAPPAGEPKRVRGDASLRTRSDDHDHREAQGEDAYGGLPRPCLREVVREQRAGRPAQQGGHESVDDLRSAPSSGRGEDAVVPLSARGEPRKRKASKDATTYQGDQPDDRARQHPRPGHELDPSNEDVQDGGAASGHRSGVGDQPGVEPPRGSEGPGGAGRADYVGPSGPHDHDGEYTAGGVALREDLGSSSDARVAVRDHPLLSDEPESCSKQQARNSPSWPPLEAFSGYVGALDVVELELCIAPRDVHSRRGVWTVNEKVKRHAEVNVRKLSPEDQKGFLDAMHREVDSYMSNEAVRVCESHGVPENRVMQMR